MRFYISFLLVISLSSALFAQMYDPVSQDTLYGNEWIDFDNATNYYKIEIAEDGMYSIAQSILPAAGVDENNFRIYHNGKEVPIYINGDNIEFYGEKNRTELDEFLLMDNAEFLNPEYSLFTDTAAYFLTWENTSSTVRFTDTPNTLVDLPAVETSFLYREIFSETSDHHKTQLKTGNVSLASSFFDQAEGFGRIVTSNNDYTRVFNLTGIVNEGVSPTLNVRYAGNNNVEHIQTFWINGENVLTEDFIEYDFRNTEVELANDLTEDTELFIDFLPAEEAASRMAIGSASITYPRSFDFSGSNSFEFKLQPSSTKKYLEITNFLGAADAVLYDITNNLRIVPTLENDLVKVVLPPSTTERKLILISQSAGINAITDFSQTTFIDYFSDDSEFIIISNPLLYFDQNGINQVQAYVDYRTNDYVSEVIDINQLYDQFAYGIKRSPISIRNFAHFTQKNNEAAKYFFLIGNAREYHEIRTSEALAASAFFLPTYGAVGSDNLLFGTPNHSSPIYPIGRLTAQNGDAVKVYLDKVQQTESTYSNSQTIADRLWMKNIIHLGGGGTDTEQSAIRSGLENMRNTIENNMFGGVTYSFFKTSTDVIEESPRDAIEGIVNNGMSILNFFGHSSPSSFDYPIQNPSEFNNQGKYFLMISNGCFSGRCHRDANGIGENFIFEPNKGAVAYIASNGFGYISALSSFTNNYYSKLGGEYYGQGIGDVFNAVIRQSATPGDRYSGLGLLAQQGTLQGDPALRLYPHSGPDLIPENSSVSVSPTLLNTQLSSFQFEADIVNIGKYNTDSINVELRLVYSNGEEGYSTLQRIPVPPSRSTISFQVPIDGNNPDVVGLNTIFLTVDSDNEYEEIPSTAELNNELKRESGQLGVEILIVSNDVIPIIPKKYGITNKQNLELVASTVDIFAEQQNFYLQIDTTATFDSPIFQEKIITQSGGLLKWQPDITFEDDVVYYWRTAPTPVDGEFRWNNSSFLFLEAAEDGWNQSHYFQFLDATFDFTQLNTNRNLSYISDFKEIQLVNGFNRFSSDNALNSRSCIRINAQGQDCNVAFFSVERGVKVYELDSITLEPIRNVFTDRKFHGFETTSIESRENLINLLQDSIEVGNYVAFFTIQKYDGYDYLPEEWAADSIELGTNIFQVLENEGADIVRDLATLGSRPYTFFYKKGYPDLIGGESMVPPLPGEEGSIDAFFNASALYTTGSVGSIEIGPASEWNTFEWDLTEELEENETSRLEMYGLKSDGTRDTILTDVGYGQTDLSDISADLYPKLELRWFNSDSLFRTAPQLDKWRVMYRGLPEVALNPQLTLELSSDTLNQGEIYNFRVGVENIGQYDTDSLLIQFSARDINNTNQVYQPRYKPLLIGETLTAEIDVNTRELRNDVNLLTDVNPSDDQPEQTHINNTGVLNFYVRADQENPLLDVTFDGVHILNGDLISPTPQVVISFTDENKFLAMSDTAQFNMTLISPDRSESRIYFNQPDVLFIPADAENLSEENKAVIEYTPEFTEDGIYTLKVAGQDATGNKSGELEYSIEFEIITKSMISNVLNYPNPFSNATRFVYTLTGNESPAFFKIQIMTVSGRIVREITQNELGEMKIGTHQTNFVWDGTDEFGDKLANGVYLYRITAKNAAGEDIEQYETAADSYFNQGFGKMVIVR